VNKNTGIATQEVTCSKCGGVIKRFLKASAYSIICPHCQTTYNAFSTNLEKTNVTFKNIYQAFDLVLGHKGIINDTSYLVVGICRKKELGTSFCWNEYLLFNPLKGYATLAEYNGHWNFIQELYTTPITSPDDAISYEGNDYSFYSIYTTETIQALGEFPFKMTSSNVKVTEYICPPYMLSVESSAEENVWYKGEYIKGNEIKKGFGLEKIKPRTGIGANQPFVSGFTPRALGKFVLVVMLIFCISHLIFSYNAEEKVVFDETYNIWDSTAQKEIYTQPFKLSPGSKNLEIRINTDVDNAWMYTGITLVNEANGDTYDVDIEAEYYHGYEDGASWSEGSSWNAKVFSQIPGGNYYLIIYPDKQSNARPTHLEVIVTRDVTITSNLVVSLAILLIFPAIYFYRRQSFESKRGM
jgi:hypothetical protein